MERLLRETLHARFKRQGLDQLRWSGIERDSGTIADSTTWRRNHGREGGRQVFLTFLSRKRTLMDGSAFEVILTAARRSLRVGEPFSLSIAVRNVSDHPIWMVGVLEGSEAGYRFPQYLPRISASRPLPQAELPRCGTILPLRLQDLRYLRPGEHFDPTAPIAGAAYQALVTLRDFRPPFPGRYALGLAVSTEVHDDEDWGGILAIPTKEAVLERLAKVPRLRVESNAEVVDVK